MATSIQQAALNSLATWLTSQISSGVEISARWPSPDRALPAKAITIIKAGNTFDTPIERNIINQVDSLLDNSTIATWQIRSRRQPLQLDVWATTEPDRDDLLAQLDSALNAAESPVTSFGDAAGSGLLLNIADGWVNSFADFSFDGPSITDTPDSVQRSEYRATISGDLYVMLTVDRTSARQIQIALSETSGLFNVTLE